ncbi:MAG: transglycosylase domain-containing protein [Thermodesulfobacteriota bacterium]|nr:MAG: transglycosylase domain-containing protein [Thermodesulfobacteriota bacterium]
MVVFAFLVGLLGVGVLCALYFYFIIAQPGKDFTRKAIMDALSRETPVYYDDGKNLIGVFFENEHRIYIKYQDIPKNFVNALVAAEDKNYFHHSGVDPLSILRAAFVNLESGKIIQGGSTLTQQTAKNLFKRSGRTFEAKLIELAQALKLEAHFSKEEIIEFFTNQFYVTGTGRGLAIAAKYFFDKSVDQLTLLECAFIAGAVRAPNRYNPLVHANQEKKKVVFERAIERKNYVLRNMAKLGMITPSQYTELFQASIPFKEGKVYFDLNVILDYIREELQSEKYQQILSEHGISNIATSGIKIYTFVNQELQQKSHLILRKHLSQLETSLSGYNRQNLQMRYSHLDIPQVIEPKIGQFVFGKVEKKIEEGKDVGIFVRVGEAIGKVDQVGLNELASAYAKYKVGMWANTNPKDVKELLSQIKVNDLVYVFVRDQLPDGIFLFDLEQKPKLEGGLLVSQCGKILAMGGGFENSYFNRAVDAKRQMGSIFKPLVYSAALQLGWNILDPLENRRDIFVFQNQFYFPRPDHESPYEKVSLAWAGAKSENVASVWLLYHLCDKLSFSQFKQIADLVDLSPRANEDYLAFQKRIRDSWGIRINERDLRESAFQAAKEELVADLIFEGRTKEAEELQVVKYGIGFDEYRPDIIPEGEEDVLEKAIEERLLKEHFFRFVRLNSEMLKKWDELKGIDPVNYADLLNRFYLGVSEGQEVVGYGEGLAGKGFIPLSYEKAIELINRGFSAEEILIEGKIRSMIVSNLGESLERELGKIKLNRAYDMITLCNIREYRVLVGLLYVVKLCESLGIHTPLEPVLSFPLGPSAVSVLEILRAYTTFTDGKQYTVRDDYSLENSIIIDRITDSEGKDIYRYRPEDKPVLDHHIAYMIAQILKNVVSYGTGNKAQDSIKLEVNLGTGGNTLTFNVPTLGKTGTANEYSNSSYIGFIPTFFEKGFDLSLPNSFVIAAYVGYDDNTPMKNNHFRIYGASGALPIWIEVANEITKNQLFHRNIDLAGLAFLSGNDLLLSNPEGAIAVPVDKGSGLPFVLDPSLGDSGDEAIVYSYGQVEGGQFRPQRFFTPFQTNRLNTQSPW